MTRLTRVTHEFVDCIPEELKDGTIYVSITFATAIHKCCCGCCRKVVTPITPADWRLTFDGESISLDPSIGSWNLPCQSHYWIERNKVVWAGQWSKGRIEAGRSRDRELRERYFDQRQEPASGSGVTEESLLGKIFGKKRRRR